MTVSVISSIVTALGLFAAPDANCAAAFERLRGHGAAPAAYVDHVAFAQVDLGDGRPRWMLIDTGANRSALDRATAAELGLPLGETTRVEGTAGVITVPTTTLPRLSLGEIETALSPTVSDLSGLAGPGGAPVAGILGSDAFGDRVLVLDFERRSLGLAAPGRGAEAGACGRAVAIENDNGVPRLAGSIDGRTVELRYDSGASLFDSPHLWLNLSEPQFRQVRGEADPGPPTAILGASGAGGQMTLKAWTAGVFRLGGLEWREPRLIVQPSQGYFARPEAVGFIGNAAFEPFGLVVIDYSAGRIVVPPAD